MKLENIKQYEQLLEHKHKETGENIIPHLHKDDEGFESHKAYMDMMKDLDPVLYKKIINWD